jgi:Aldehyde oxidase and xanthine dehydrogenase, a/b hammerhead domain
LFQHMIEGCAYAANASSARFQLGDRCGNGARARPIAWRVSLQLAPARRPLAPDTSCKLGCLCSPVRTFNSDAVVMTHDANAVSQKGLAPERSHWRIGTLNLNRSTNFSVSACYRARGKNRRRDRRKTDSLKNGAIRRRCRFAQSVLRCEFCIPHAHAPIKHVDVCKAKATPGVLLVLTGDHDKRDQLGGFTAAMMPADLGAPKRTSRLSASFQVRINARFVGDRIAFVVAQALAQARDAGELVEVNRRRSHQSRMLRRRAPRVWSCLLQKHLLQLYAETACKPCALSKQTRGGRRVAPYRIATSQKTRGSDSWVKNRSSAVRPRANPVLFHNPAGNPRPAATQRRGLIEVIISAAVDHNGAAFNRG